MNYMKSRDSKFIFITLILSLLLGVPTFISVFEPQATQALSSMNSVIEVTAESVIKTSNSLVSSRQPASATTETKASEKLQEDLFCESRSKRNLASLEPSVKAVAASLVSRHRIRSEFVQLLGKNCLQKMDQRKLTVINTSNGYTASFFPMESQEYQTDLIRLSEGINRIEVEVVGPGTQRESKTIEIFTQIKPNSTY